MKKSNSRFGLALLALACPFLLQGCLAVVGATAVGVGVGYYQYDQNEVHRDFPTDLEGTWDATLAAMRQQGYAVLPEYRHGPTGGEIEVESQDTWVKVARHAEGFTRVHVRIGTFASEDHHRRSNLLLASIAERLE